MGNTRAGSSPAFGTMERAGEERVFPPLFHHELRGHRKRFRHLQGLLAHGIVAVDQSLLDKSIFRKKSVRRIIDRGGMDEHLLDFETPGQDLHVSKQPLSNSPALIFRGDGDGY